MKKEIQQLINSLQEAFEGDPWFGISLLKSLDVIQSEFTTKGIAGSNSIAKLLAHLLQWRVFVIEKIKGNEGFDIELNSEQDWPEYQISSKDDWIVLIDKIKKSQIELIQLLKEKEDLYLNEITLGKAYTNRVMLEGVILHDTYHLGQINLIYKQLKRSKG